MTLVTQFEYILDLFREGRKEDDSELKNEIAGFSMILEHRDEPIPKISTYDTWKDGQGNLKIEDIEPLMNTLQKAWEIASEGRNVKFGDTDEADSISGVMSGIQKKYQDKATLEQRKKWRY